MKDNDIRQALLSELTSKYKKDPETIIIEELGLCQGEARIDIAIVNGSIHGIEIKSDQDTLKRLDGQIEIYSRCLDMVTLVVGPRYLEKALNVIPKWWGVTKAESNNEKIILQEIRAHQNNPSPDAEAIIQLIWRDEALDLLRKNKLHDGYLTKKKWVLYQRIIENLSLDELREEVRNKLKSRGNWRSVQSLA
jgi:hypothetical protein